MNYNAKRTAMRQSSISQNEVPTTSPLTPQPQNRQVILLSSNGNISMSQSQPPSIPPPIMTTQTVITTVMQPGVSGGGTPIIDDAPVSLVTEIADIMRSFGDSDQPRQESVRLVEQILQQQLRGIFNEASLIAARRRKNPCPTQADFEFLMRNHSVKIARMRKHLKDMRILKRFLSIRTGRPQDFVEEAEQQENEEELPVEVPDLYDEERTRRLFRADRISQILSGQQYLEFNEARKTSFYCRHGEKIKNKFRRFLDLPADLRIPIPTMNILAYFAHETIGVIVDYAILTRLNADNRVTEPYGRVTTGAGRPELMHICPEVTQGRGMEVVKPISVQEIHEGIRRFRQMSNKRIGTYRTACDIDSRRSFLAI